MLSRYALVLKIAVDVVALGLHLVFFSFSFRFQSPSCMRFPSPFPSPFPIPLVVQLADRFPPFPTSLFGFISLTHTMHASIHHSYAFYRASLGLPYTIDQVSVQFLCCLLSAPSLSLQACMVCCSLVL